MTNKEFAEKLHEVFPLLSLTECRKALYAIGDIAAAELLGGGDVPIPHVGKLKVRQVKARTGHNPRTGEPIAIPEKRAVRFSVVASFDKAMN